jgi:hypothetical protein
MKRDISPIPEPASVKYSTDSAGELRTFAAWMGLVIIAFGLAMAGYLFYRVGQVLLDPRSFETQVDRWEFVVRGRTTDAFPQTYETPDRKRITIPPVDGAANPNQPAADANQPRDRSEEIAQFVGRLGSESARPAALLLIILVLSILVRIAIGIINAGIRLAYLTSGEKDYMKRIIDELVDQRNQSR